MTACVVCGVQVEAPCHPHEPGCWAQRFEDVDCWCPTPPVCPDHCRLCQEECTRPTTEETSHE